MAFGDTEHPAAPAGSETPLNGAALAAFLAAGIGAFALGLILVLNEAGIFAAPTLYGPAGGVSGRTSLAVLVWLGAWAALHFAWRERQLESRGVTVVTLLLTALGILATFPPVWAVF